MCVLKSFAIVASFMMCIISVSGMVITEVGLPPDDNDAAFIELYSANLKGRPMNTIPVLAFGYGKQVDVHLEQYYIGNESGGTDQFENFPDDGFLIICNNKDYFNQVYLKTCDFELDSTKALDVAASEEFAIVNIENYEDFEDYNSNGNSNVMLYDEFIYPEEFDRAERKPKATHPSMDDFDQNDWVIELSQNKEGMNPRSWSGVCQDEDEETCDYVRLDKKTRCPEYKETCPQTCGRCPCQDNRFKRFIRVPGKELKQGCSWVRKDPTYRCQFKRADRKCQSTCNEICRR